MANQTLGTAYVQIKPSTQGLSADIGSAMSSSGASAGQTFGGKFGSAFSKMGVGAKIATGVAAGAAAAGVAGKAIWDIANKAAATTDNIDKMSQKIGLSRKAYQEWDYIMSQNGMSIDNMKAGMKTLTTQLASAQNGSSASAEAFAALGISMEQASSMSREDLFSAAVAGLQGVSDETERATLANKLFGRSGAEMAPLLNQSAASTEALRQKANDLGLVMSDNAIDAGVKLTDTIDTMKRSFGALGTQIGVAVIPVVQKVLDFIIAHMPQIMAVVKPVFRALGAAIKVVVTAVGTLWKAFDTAFNKIKIAVDKIRSVVNTFKSLFRGEARLKLKIPHITLSGGKAPWGIGGAGTLPKFNVKWNAEGGIFDSASIIGYGVGEAGAEAIVPLDKLWQKMDAIAGTGGGGTATFIINFDGKTIAEKTIEYANEQTVIFGMNPIMV